MYDFIFKVYKLLDVCSLMVVEKVEIVMKMDYKFRIEVFVIIDLEESFGKESLFVLGIGELLDFVWDYLVGVVWMFKIVLKG